MTTDIEACTAALRMVREEGFSVNDVARFNALIGGAKMTQIDIDAAVLDVYWKGFPSHYEADMMDTDAATAHIRSTHATILDEMEAARAEIVRLQRTLLAVSKESIALEKELARLGR